MYVSIHFLIILTVGSDRLLFNVGAFSSSFFCKESNRTPGAELEVLRQVSCPTRPEPSLHPISRSLKRRGLEFGVWGILYYWG